MASTAFSAARLWRGGPLFVHFSVCRALPFSALLCYNIAKELKRMIRHMIFWNLAEENADRGETERFLKETFAAMVGAVPGLRAWTAWRPWPPTRTIPPMWLLNAGPRSI